MTMSQQRRGLCLLFRREGCKTSRSECMLRRIPVRSELFNRVLLSTRKSPSCGHGNFDFPLSYNTHSHAVSSRSFSTFHSLGLDSHGDATMDLKSWLCIACFFITSVLPDQPPQQGNLTLLEGRDDFPSRCYTYTTTFLNNVNTQGAPGAGDGFTSAEYGTGLGGNGAGPGAG